MTVWDVVYSRGMFLWSPHETLVQFVSRFLKRRLSLDTEQVLRDGSRVIDLGCGNGAQSIYMSGLGFDVVGVDISREAISVANAWAERDGLSACFSVASATCLPMPDDVFDVVISYGVLDHLMPDDGKAALGEAARVLSPGGIAWITLASSESSEFGQGSRVAENTFAVEEGFEAGTVQHYFDQAEVTGWAREAGLNILDMRHQVETRFSDDAATGRSARWFVTATPSDPQV